MEPSPDLFRFDSATISRADGKPTLRDVSWCGAAGLSWAVVGPTGSGKTTLLEALAGRHRVNQGSRTIPPPEAIALVGFREDSRLFSPSNFYYQQRFEFNEPDDCPTAREYLSAGIDASTDAVVAQFHLADLLDLKLLKLSNGQQRRLRIARGLLKQPRLLLLDDSYSGLDTAMRVELNGYLSRLAQKGLTIVLTCRADEVPEWVSHVLELGTGPVARAEPPRPVLDETAGLGDPARPTSDAILQMSNVSIRHGGQIILDGVNWTVHLGERWAVLGPNGSGKSTLLSLFCGDHPQAFANDIRLFCAPRGSGETIWDVKKRIGLVSPEMHQYFPRMLTAREAVASGFCDRFAPEKLTAEQETEVRRLLLQFHLSGTAERAWWQLSTGTQRLLLFLRAIVKRPELLILDEPFQGMDRATIRQVHAWLASELAPEQTLLLVVHDEAELPAGITGVLRLREGRVVPG